VSRVGLDVRYICCDWKATIGDKVHEGCWFVSELRIGWGNKDEVKGTALYGTGCTGLLGTRSALERPRYNYHTTSVSTA
jgi:hypothetical protein